MLALVARIRTTPEDAVREMTKFMEHHLVVHFAYEEALMEDVGYPDISLRRGRHAEFLRQVRVLQERLQSEGVSPEAVAILAGTVEAWIAEHVLDQGPSPGRVHPQERTRQSGGETRASPTATGLAQHEPGRLRKERRDRRRIPESTASHSA